MEISYQHKKKCKRGELLRIFWMIPVGLVLYVWGIVACVLMLVHFVQILIKEERDKKIHEQLGYFWKYQWQWTMYTIWLDDNQPEWNPFEFVEACQKPSKKK